MKISLTDEECNIQLLIEEIVKQNEASLKNQKEDDSNRKILENSTQILA